MSPDPHPRPPLAGLYVILDAPASRGRSLEEILVEAASVGARFFQYRNKAASQREAYAEAVRLRRVAHRVGALLVVNDRCDLALAVEADGVHLGQEDLPLPLARSLLGPRALIGVSTHRPEQVVAATHGGADYLGFGPIFETGTKPDHEPVVGVEGLRRIRSLTPLPVFAIGGITLDRVEAVIGAGATGIAVVSAVAGAVDVAGAVRAFIQRCSR